MRQMGTFFGVIAAVYVAVAASVYLMQERMVFLANLPGRDLRATPPDAGLPYQALRLPTADGETLDAWLIPAPDARYTLVHFHGNAGNIGDRLELAQIFHGLGVNLLLFDYRGYGRSTGKPSEQGAYRDAEAVWQYLTREHGLDQKQIVLHGQSLGGAVAAWLAARTRPAALILESTFTSAPDIGAEIYPWLPVRLLSRLRLDTQAALAQVRCPVLVLHSRDDEIIPFHHGERLFAAAPEPKHHAWFRGDHNSGFLISRTEYEQALRAFLARLP